MTKFDFHLAETESATKINAKARTLKATTALASTFTAGALAMGLGAAVMVPIQAQAKDNTIASGDNTVVWGSADVDADSVSPTAAAAGENVIFDAAAGDSDILSITNNGTNNDGSADTNTFAVGAITAGADAKGNVAVEAHNIAGDHGDLTVSIESMGTETDESIKALTVTGGAGASDTGAGTTGTTGNAANTTLGSSYVDAVTVTGGAGADGGGGTGGTGGASSLTLSGDLEGAITIAGGAAGDSTSGTGGTGGNAIVYAKDDINGDVAMTSASGAASLVFNGDSSTAGQGSDTATTSQALIGNVTGAGTVQNSTSSEYLWIGGNVGADASGAAAESDDASGNKITTLQLDSGTTTLMAGALGVTGSVAGSADGSAQGGSLDLRSNGVQAGVNGQDNDTTTRYGGSNTTSDITGDVNLSSLTVRGSHAASAAADGTGEVIGGTNALTVGGDIAADVLTIIGGDGGNAVDIENGTNEAGLGGGSSTLTALGNIIGDITLDDGSDGTTRNKAGGPGGSAILNIGDAAAGAADSEHTITGSISAAGAGEGSIVINNDADADSTDGVGVGVTFTGDVGSSTAAIGSIEQTSGYTTYQGGVYTNSYTQTAGDATFVDLSAGTYTQAAGAITVSGNMDVTDFVHVEGDLIFSGDTAQTITVVDNDTTAAQGTAGLVSTKGDIIVDNTVGTTFTNDVTVTEGNLTVSAGGTATFGGDITLGTDDGLFTVESDATAVINGGTFDGAADDDTSTIAGTLQLNGELKLAGTDSNIEFANGSILALGMTEGTALNASGGTFSATGTDDITVKAANGMKDGNVVTVSTGDLSFDNFVEKVASTNLMNFTLSDDSGKILLTATSKSTADIADALSLSASESESLLAAFNNSTNAQFADFIGDATAEEAALVADQTAVQEETLTASVGAISGAANQVATITVDRLASLRTGDAYGLEADQAAAGFATGDGAMTGNVWGKLFYNVADQDTVDDSDGYDADTSGLAFGTDTDVGANMRVGASLAMSQSEVEGKGGGDAQTDIDSYQLTVYGDLTQSDYFVDWQIGASNSSVETTTTVDPASGVSGSNSDYDSMTYIAKVGLGMPMEMEGTSRFTPYGSLGFQRISSDDYDLIFPDDPGLNQNVSPDDVNEVSVSLGGRYTMSGQTSGGGTVTPQIRGAISYDFIGDTPEATSTYADQTSLTVKGTEAEKIGAALGVGVNYVSDAASLGVDLDSTMKDGYASYTGALNFRLQF